MSHVSLETLSQTELLAVGTNLAVHGKFLKQKQFDHQNTKRTVKVIIPWNQQQKDQAKVSIPLHNGYIRAS